MMSQGSELRDRTRPQAARASALIMQSQAAQPADNQKLALVLFSLLLVANFGQGASGASGRMVRLCIASVDPSKLSSQCVMCNRREFPLTVIDCTGITKVNDLIANPLSVQEATCLIYNCRRQVPDVKPEPYHGSVSHAANYRPQAAAASAVGFPPRSAAGSRPYETLAPSGVLASETFDQEDKLGAQFVSRYGSPFQGRPASVDPLGARAQPAALPYALVPAPPSRFPFGSRKYKAALVPLFR